MAEPGIRVEGVRELQRALRQIDKDLPKELRKEFNDIAGLVIRHARPLVPVRTGAAAASLKPRSSQRTVGIAVGGTRAPYYPWLDFGGRVGRAGTVRRPFVPGGRYLFPTVRAHEAEILAQVGQALDRLARVGDIDMKGGGS